MHEPANMPVVVIFHEEAMKQESMVYQFQSIYRISKHQAPFRSCVVDLEARGALTEILQPLPPPMPPIPPLAARVGAGIPAVEVIVIVAIPGILWLWSIVTGAANSSCVDHSIVRAVMGFRFGLPFTQLNN